ncbi:hypothetical protein JOM56_013892 [Amanita muscaria]
MIVLEPWERRYRASGMATGDWHKETCSTLQNHQQLEHAVEGSGEKLSARTSLGLHLERAWGLATGDGIERDGDWRLAKVTKPALRSQNISSLTIQSRNQGKNSALKVLRVFIREVKGSEEKLSALTSPGLHSGKGMATGDWRLAKESEEKLSAQTSPGLHSGRHGDWGLARRNLLYGHRNISSLNIQSRNQGENSALKGLRVFIREGKATGDWRLARVTKPALRQGIKGKTQRANVSGSSFFIREGMATGDWLGQRNLRNQKKNSARKHLRVFVREGMATGDWRLARQLEDTVKESRENSAHKHLRVFVREGMATGDWLGNLGKNSARRRLRVFIREGMATGDWLGQRNLLYGHRKLAAWTYYSQGIKGKTQRSKVSGSSFGKA